MITHGVRRTEQFVVRKLTDIHEQSECRCRNSGQIHSSRVANFVGTFSCSPLNHFRWWLTGKGREIASKLRIWILRRSVTLRCTTFKQWLTTDTAMHPSNRCIALVYAFSVLLFLIGSILISILPGIVRKGVLEAVLLKNNSEAAKLWQQPPYDMSMEIRLFNVTNANDVIFYGAKPVLEELGPYTFEQHQRKINVQFHENGTISYKNLKWYRFSPLLSCAKCQLSDAVIVPSIPFWTLVHKLRRMGSLPKLKKFISYGLLGLGEHPLVSHTVDELLFSGYSDMLFSMAKSLHWLSPDTELPEKMGFMYGRNYSADGPFLIKSGTHDYKEKGIIELYKGKPSINCWSLPDSDMINGSDGTVYPPFFDKLSRLRLFSPDLYRSLYLEFLTDLKIGKFHAYRYTVPESVFSDSLIQNAGYCWPTDIYYPSSQKADPQTGLACLPSGLLNISKCQMGAPVVISSPHFLYSDREVQSSVLGLRPNVEDHATFIDFEPVSGAGLVFQRKLQINVAMIRDDDFSTLKHLRSVIMPVLWIKEIAYLNSDAKSDLWSRLFVPQMVASGVGFSLIGLGAVVLITGIVLHIRHRRRNKDDPS